MSQRVLVVDDELYMLRLIQHTLEKAGYDFIPARSGQEAREALKEKPDLIVADPKVVNDGVQKTLIEFQEKNQTGPIPMICVSDAPTATEAKSDGQYDSIVFTKPFSPTKLLAEVKRLMPRPSEGGAAP